MGLTKQYLLYEALDWLNYHDFGLNEETLQVKVAMVTSHISNPGYILNSQQTYNLHMISYLIQNRFFFQSFLHFFNLTSGFQHQTATNLTFVLG